MIGQRVGAYTIVQRLGEGGMGAVWLAEHTTIGRRAALKMLHESIAKQPDLARRFLNEARAAASIQDPGIVQIFELGEHVDGRAYIVMELLDGESLDRRLSRMGRIPLHDALRILRQIASALSAAHRLGIVHRDLKPENIFLVRDAEVSSGERAKLLDFGIAKIFDANAPQTEALLVMGTPSFMSPEQCRGAGKIDQRSDVYALGCLAFNLLTGRLVFIGDGPGDVMAMHLREPPPTPSDFVVGLPAGVDELILRCLEKEPAKRFASATEAAEALEKLAVTTEKMRGLSRDDDISHKRRAAGSRQVTTISAASYSVSQDPAHPDKTHGSGRWKLIALAAMVIAASVTAMQLQRADTPSSESRTPEIAAAPSSQVPPQVETKPARAPQDAPSLSTTPPTEKPEANKALEAAPVEPSNARGNLTNQALRTKAKPAIKEPVKDEQDEGFSLPTSPAPPPVHPQGTGTTLTARYKSVGALLTRLPKETSGSLWSRFSKINKNRAAEDPALRQAAMEQLFKIELDANALLQEMARVPTQ